jgi:hypothetical protein
MVTCAFFRSQAVSKCLSVNLHLKSIIHGHSTIAIGHVFTHNWAHI